LIDHSTISQQYYYSPQYRQTYKLSAECQMKSDTSTHPYT